MRFLLAFDKFKQALDAPAACAAAVRGLRLNYPEAYYDECPLTDGGEGFAEILTRSAGGVLVAAQVTGPREKPVIARYGLVPVRNLASAVQQRLSLAGASALESDHIAVIEMATASGLALISPSELDPWLCTTAGTGELLRAAAAHNVRAILLGVGGSATNDLGLGALAELGYNFTDNTGARIDPRPQNWDKITRIIGNQEFRLPPVFIACDVTNPLYGPRGAAAIYGPQKGLKADDWVQIDAATIRMASLLCGACGRESAVADTPGAGAAGGIAFGLMVGVGASLLPGSDLVADWLDLAGRISLADVVLTGEGSFDSSSLAGKGPGFVVSSAQTAQKKIHVFAGRIDLPPTNWLHSITPNEMPLKDALLKTHILLEQAVSMIRFPSANL